MDVGIMQKEEHVPTYGGFYAFMASNFNSTHIRTNPKMINRLMYDKISLTDVRRQMWCDDVNDVVNFPGVIGGMNLTPIADQKRVRLMHNKFRVVNPVSRAGDIPLMRAGEMYLIAAEAYAQSSPANDIAAQNALFTLASNRDPNYVLSLNTGTSLKNEISDQRRIELWGEGFRFLDLKRTNSSLSRGNANTTGVNSVWASVTTTSAGSDCWQFKLPQREVDGNPYITKNNP